MNHLFISLSLFIYFVSFKKNNYYLITIMTFSGYYVALPDISDGIRVMQSPSSVLISAWKAVQPQAFPDDSLITS